ncbi:MAG: hypothetical protein MUF73_14825 [Rhodobacteraceae bacterium]|jgi:hypothetical protein|nr:hypothetical protein [Paracoccaceae bacterium]
MLIDPRHPFYRPKWRRIVIVLLPLIWAGVEFVNGAVFWGMIFGAIGVYAAWVLILIWPKDLDGPQG